MLVRLIKYVKGYVRIRIEGYSPERFLNLCSAHKILIWDLKNAGLTYELTLSVRDYKKLRPLVRKTKNHCVLLEKSGLPFFLHRFRRRRIFFAGAFLCAGMIYVLSLFLWNIHVEGNQSNSTDTILTYLAAIGVTHGKYKGAISCEAVEESLRNEFPDILWVSAELRGTRMILEIRENTDRDIVSAEKQENTSPTSLLAAADGVIESMVVRKGTPAAAIGDTVTRGQLLVEGYYGIKNDAGEIQSYKGTYADADVVIRTWQNYHDRFSMIYEKKVPTGREKRGLILCLGDHYLTLKTENSYKNSEITSVSHQLHLTENFYLPVSLQMITAREMEIKKSAYTKNEARSMAQQRFLAVCENILQKGVQIVEKNVKIDINGQSCESTGSMELLVKDMSRSPAKIPETVTNTSQEGENQT